MALGNTSSATNPPKISSGLHSLTAFTWMGWFFLYADDNRGQLFFYANNAGDTQWIGCGCAADGTTLRMETQGASVSSAITIKLNTWFHACLVKNGSSFVLYYNGLPVVITTDSSANNLITQLGVGNDAPGDFLDALDGRLEGIKIFSAALSAAEVRAEMRQHKNVRRSSVYNVTPFYTYPDVRDQGGSNHPFAFGGDAWSTASGPGKPWVALAPLPRRFITSAGVSAANLVLQSVDAVSSVTNLVIGTPLVTLQTVAAVSAVSNLVVSAPVLIAPDTVAAVSSVSNLLIKADAYITLGGVAAVSSVDNLVVSAPLPIPLQGVTTVSAVANLVLSAPLLIPLDPVAGTSAANNLVVASPAPISPATVAAESSAALAVSTIADIVPSTVAAVSSVNNLEITTDAVVGGSRPSLLRHGRVG